MSTESPNWIPMEGHFNEWAEYRINPQGIREWRRVFTGSAAGIEAQDSHNAYKAQERLLGEKIVERYVPGKARTEIYLADLGEPFKEWHEKNGTDKLKGNIARGRQLYDGMRKAGFYVGDAAPNQLVINDTGRVAIADLGTVEKIPPKDKRYNEEFAYYDEESSSLLREFGIE